MQQILNQEEPGPKYIDSRHWKSDEEFNSENLALVGDFWEYYVALEAIRRGAIVLKNFVRCGPIDLALVWKGMEVHCDVKARVVRNKTKPNCYYQNSLTLIPENIFMICPHPVTRIINWHTDRVPKGWEDFWNDPSI